MNPNRRLIDVYESNRTQLANALENAGGASDLILTEDHWREVMYVLATNNIKVNAVYEKP